MENFKYIHLLLGYDAKFSGPLVETFYKNHDIFRLEEHLFITPYESVKDSLSDYPNLVLDDESDGEEFSSEPDDGDRVYGAAEEGDPNGREQDITPGSQIQSIDGEETESEG